MLKRKTDECEYTVSRSELLGIAELIGDYVKMLSRSEPKRPSQTHWLVSALKQYADKIGRAHV